MDLDKILLEVLFKDVMIKALTKSPSLQVDVDGTRLRSAAKPFLCCHFF